MLCNFLTFLVAFACLDRRATFIGLGVCVGFKTRLACTPCVSSSYAQFSALEMQLANTFTSRRCDSPCIQFMKDSLQMPLRNLQSYTCLVSILKHHCKSYTFMPQRQESITAHSIWYQMINTKKKIVCNDLSKKDKTIEIISLLSYLVGDHPSSWNSMIPTFFKYAKWATNAAQNCV